MAICKVTASTPVQSVEPAKELDGSILEKLCELADAAFILTPSLSGAYASPLASFNAKQLFKATSFVFPHFSFASSAYKLPVMVSSESAHSEREVEKRREKQLIIDQHNLDEVHLKSEISLEFHF